MTTIYDVARAAGVTAATVSNVLSGKGSVSAATRARVKKYADELGYHPNLVARSLIKGRTGVIGFVVPTLENPFFAELTVEAEQAAYEAGFRIFITSLTNKDGKVSQHLLQDLTLRRVDGILLASGGQSMKMIYAMAASHLPIVHCLWEGNEETAATIVSFDYLQAGQLAAQHLLLLGHRRFGIACHVAIDDKQLRLVGFRDTVLHAGAALPLMQPGNSTIESGRIAGRELLTMSPRPTAIFAMNDITAFGVMTMAWELGLHIPRDLSIIGMDDITLAAYTSPPLTSVRIDKKLIIAKAFEILLQCIEGQPVSPQTLVPATLVVRSSTGPPPAEPFSS